MLEWIYFKRPEDAGLCSMKRPREHIINQAIRNVLVRGEPALRNSVVAFLCGSELMEGETATELSSASI